MNDLTTTVQTSPRTTYLFGNRDSIILSHMMYIHHQDSRDALLDASFTVFYNNLIQTSNLFKNRDLKYLNSQSEEDLKKMIKPLSSSLIDHLNIVDNGFNQNLLSKIQKDFSKNDKGIYLTTDQINLIFQPHIRSIHIYDNEGIIPE